MLMERTPGHLPTCQRWVPFNRKSDARLAASNAPFPVYPE